MRIGLCYPDYENYPKWRWIHLACADEGHEVLLIRNEDQLKAADRTADMILFSQRHEAAPNAWQCARDHKAKWITWYFDTFAMEYGRPINQQSALVGAGTQPIPTGHLRNLQAMDLVLCKDRSLLPEIREMGIKAEWFDQACPVDMPECEHVEVPEWDVLIYGSMGPMWTIRHHCLQILSEESFAVVSAGHGGEFTLPRHVLPLPYTQPFDLPRLASRAAITLCVDYRHDIDGYSSDRIWFALGSGSCVLRRFTPGMTTRDDRTVPYEVFNSDEEMVAKVIELRRDLARRKELGRQARSWTMDNHTYHHRIRHLQTL